VGVYYTFGSLERGDFGYSSPVMPVSHFPELHLLDVLISPPSFRGMYCTPKLGVGHCFGGITFCIAHLLSCYHTHGVPPGGGLGVGWLALVEGQLTRKLDGCCERISGYLNF